jgi:hypothetical protein
MERYAFSHPFLHLFSSPELFFYHLLPIIRLSGNFYIPELILIRIDTNYPWGVQIQVNSNEGKHPSSRRDNGKIVRERERERKAQKFFSKSYSPHSN